MSDEENASQEFLVDCGGGVVYRGADFLNMLDWVHLMYRGVQIGEAYGSLCSNLGPDYQTPIRLSPDAPIASSDQTAEILQHLSLVGMGFYVKKPSYQTLRGMVKKTDLQDFLRRLSGLQS